MSARRTGHPKPLYRAWVRRRPDIIAPFPEDIIYDREPHGNLVGNLPGGAWPLPKGQCGTLDRTDGGDPFENALFTSASGRIYVIERTNRLTDEDLPGEVDADKPEDAEVQS